MTDKKENKHEGACPEIQLWEGQLWDPAHLRKIQEHPCYSPKAVHAFGRIHLPVAPKCNMQCNYCIRDFDCVHESRPGVTSLVLSPKEALDRVSETVKKFPNIKVVGVAGPGEPLYNEETFETFGLIKNNFPRLCRCVSSNGLLLLEKMEELEKVMVTNITVTLNALQPEIGEKIYSFIIHGGKTYRGSEGAQILLQNQLAGIEMAVRRGMIVKVNTVLIPGINDRHILRIAQKAKELGVYIYNLMPLIPQYLLAHVPPPTVEERKRIQDECAKVIQQMRHCRQCRADAIGKLGEDISPHLYRAMSRYSFKDLKVPKAGTEDEKIKVAVTTTGLSGLVDLHFGHADVFSIYEVNAKTLSVQFLEKRSIKKAICKGPGCDQPQSQEALLRHVADVLKDCKLLLTRRIGIIPAIWLKEAGITPIEGVDIIENAIRKIFTHQRDS